MLGRFLRIKDLKDTGVQWSSFLYPKIKRYSISDLNMDMGVLQNDKGTAQNARKCALKWTFEPIQSAFFEQHF